MLQLDDLEFEDNFTHMIGPDEPIHSHYYLAPVLVCACGKIIELVYRDLPETDQKGLLLLRGEDPPETPQAVWIAIFGCLKCGRVSAYRSRDVKLRAIHQWK